MYHRVGGKLGITVILRTSQRKVQMPYPCIQKTMTRDDKIKANIELRLTERLTNHYEEKQ